MPSHIYLPSCVVMFEEKDDEIRKVHTVCVAAAVLVGVCSRGENAPCLCIRVVCAPAKVLYVCILHPHFLCVWLMEDCCQDRDGSGVLCVPEVLRLSH